MVSKIAELLDGGEHIDEFEQAPTEKIEFAKDFALIEVKLPAFWLQQQTLLRKAVLFVESLLFGGASDHRQVAKTEANR